MPTKAILYVTQIHTKYVAIEATCIILKGIWPVKIPVLIVFHKTPRKMANGQPVNPN